MVLRHLRGWEERRQAIAGAADKAGHTRDLLARHGIDCPTVTGAGTGTFEFETASGVYTELQCGSYIFMDADYGRNLDRDGAASGVFILSRAREQMLLAVQNGARIAIHRPETACHPLTTRGPSCTMDCGSSTIE